MFPFLLFALKRSYADNETLNRRNSQTFFVCVADDFTLQMIPGSISVFNLNIMQPPIS